MIRCGVIIGIAICLIQLILIAVDARLMPALSNWSFPLIGYLEYACLLGTLVLLVLFTGRYYQEQQRLKSLEFCLETRTRELLQMKQRFLEMNATFQERVLKQFEEWSFTSSEREIGLFLLKGLSFKEIAELRQTAEKTVRQHGASIYNKASLNGRHELAAWFFLELNTDLK